MNFFKKRVIVTGGAGQIGQWIAKAFAGKGASLWLVDIREDALERVVGDSAFSAATEVRTTPMNLRDSEAIQAFAKEVEQAWGAPDILINNAGIYTSEMLIDMSTESWNKVMGLNLTAPFEMTKELGKLMIEHAVQGSIINIISKSSFVPRMGSGHYAVSKAGLHMLTRAYSMELAKDKIRVNSVSPGFTPGSEYNQLDEEYVQAMASTIPLGRFAESQDAAQAILFLCSEEASYITGAMLTVDGGNSAGNYSLPVSAK